MVEDNQSNNQNSHPADSNIEKKLKWMKQARAGRPLNPFVNARPDLIRVDSSNDLIASQNNSRTDLFRNSSLDFFERSTSPKPETNRYSLKAIPFWEIRTPLEKILIICCVVFFLVIVLLFVFLTTGETVTIKEESDLCLNPACIYSASEVLRSIDSTVDPCDDFYGFACGGWIKNNPIPDGKSTWGIFSKLELQNQLITRNALEKVDPNSSSRAEQKARIYYDACMDVNRTVENLGGKPLIGTLKTLNGWYLLPETEPTPITFQDLFQRVQNDLNLGGLFNWAVSEDDRNSSKHVIILDQGGLTLPTREYYLNKTAHQKVLEAYLQYMTDVMTLLGANKSLATQEMQKVIEFETKIAEITTPNEERRDDEAMYNPISVEKFNETVTFIDWLTFLNHAFAKVNKTIPSNATLVVYEPEFFHRLTNLLTQYTSTETGQKTVTSYLMWQVCRTLSPYLSKPFRDAAKVLKQALYGSEGSEEDWRFCVSDTNNALGFAVGAMYVREVFQGSAKAEGEEMIEGIKAAFKKNFVNLKWMDVETRQAAEQKADAIDDMIGFPDYILNPKELDAQYEDMDIQPNKYFENYLAYSKDYLIQTLSKLDKPVNRTKWGMVPSAVNAYYTPTKNQIVFPAGILQLPFYDGDNPRCINYGAMGVVMGHELTHAFDDQGREYDKFGNLNRWWNNSTIDAFKKRAKCFENQYSAYEVFGLHLNGKQTLGENMADNGGLKAAFHAYVEQSKEAKINFTLPGVHYSHRQIFFISFAQVWCSSMTKEATRLQIEKDDHTVSKYRVIGPISNLKEFSEEFNCKPGKKMNPIDKCEVW